jgi:glucose-1-phosphate adenylyltransferase
VVEDAVLFAGVDIGERAVIHRAILDKDVVVEAGANIGVDADADRARFTVSDGGVVVVAKGARVSADT